MLIDLDSWVHAVTIRSLKQSPHALCGWCLDHTVHTRSRAVLLKNIIHKDIHLIGGQSYSLVTVKLNDCCLLTVLFLIVMSARVPTKCTQHLSEVAGALGRLIHSA